MQRCLADFAISGKNGACQKGAAKIDEYELMVLLALGRQGLDQGELFPVSLKHHPAEEITTLGSGCRSCQGIWQW